MKFGIAAILLSVVVLAVANDVEEGQRQEGDVLVSSRRLYRPAIPHIEMVAKTGYNTKGVITAVRAVNAPNTDANVTVVKGGAGQNKVVVMAIGRPGHVVDVQVDIYAIQPGSTTTEAPPS